MNNSLYLPNLQSFEIGEYSLGIDSDLVIENYPNLEKIIVKKSSLNNVNSLKIRNNKKLKTIVIEDGESWNVDGKWYNSGALKNVKEVMIDSILIIINLIFKSSKSTINPNRRLVFLFNNKFIFVK